MSTNQPLVAIGLGGNLGDAPATLLFAIDQLNDHPDIHLHAVSPLYRSAPIGPAGQPDYANAAALLTTPLAPDDLLTALQGIEQLAGRERLVRWGARTLDLDLLLYGSITVHSPRLTIPHVALCHRPFVLIPLHDIAPTLILPDGQALTALANACSREGLARWPDSRWDSICQGR